MATAISFEHVSKMYQLGLVGTGTLSRDINRWWQTSVLGKPDPYLQIGQTNDRTTKGTSDFVYALKDITFDVEQGDVIGIIGKNGAGKSTLLKLLSRITAPSTGTIKAKGRIASLLEVGTGFHSELTGRENIYLNGSIMGMTKQEIDRKLDEIVDFAGVERYLDTPTKRYSSGMTVRLGFAVAAFLEPEILVVDEVLAVGDAEFQKKAIGKMQDVSQGEGRTVLFVSHNMNSVRALCKHGVVLKNGMVEMLGTADECVDFYVGSNISEFRDHVVIEGKNNDFAKEIEILELRMLNDVENVSTAEPLQFELTLKSNSKAIREFQIGAFICNSSDVRVGAAFTQPVQVGDSDIFKASFTVDNHQLTLGKYRLDFIVGKRDLSSSLRVYDAAYHTLSFNVKYQDVMHQQPILYWAAPWGCCSFDTSVVTVRS